MAQQAAKPAQAGALKRVSKEEQKGQGPKEPEQAAPILMLPQAASLMMQPSAPI